MRGVAESQQTRCGSQTQLTSSIFHRPTLATKKGPEPVLLRVLEATLHTRHPLCTEAL